ncbi:very long chain fatty acid elongase 7-like [Alosa pseudoharengus]|uniref:very long chain fatty acid elongase 7-like n=1 Tax=Alosa pseudoharengus TaxID=34774 RepID=UPI003F8B97DA
MSSPLPQTVITIAYLCFVISLGPRLMENRKPFDLKKVMFIYNVCIRFFCLYMFYEFLMSGWATGYSYRCDIVDYSNSPKALRMAQTCWLYYFSKFIEMLDTIFFVIQKKTVQLTFLHIYHHIVAAYTWWFVVKFAEGGMSTFHALLNSIVHVLMYSYYALAALGPAYQKYLWWKKYMTTIQLTQFVMVIIHLSQFFFIEDCRFQVPLIVYILYLLEFIFLGLFLDFYYHAYMKGKRKATIALV